VERRDEGEVRSTRVRQRQRDKESQRQTERDRERQGETDLFRDSKVNDAIAMTIVFIISPNKVRWFDVSMNIAFRVNIFYTADHLLGEIDGQG
jgi:hypothetical protein